ncbi:13673_t:CDS:1, partial [Racocetra persica]
KERLNQLQLEQYEYYTNLINETENIPTLNKLSETIYTVDKVLTSIQVSNLLRIIVDKIFRINQKQEYDSIKEGIINEKDSTKLEVDWRDVVDNAKYLNNEQKNKLQNLVTNQKWEIRGLKKFEQYKTDIQNEPFFSNLLDGKLFDTLIKNDGLLTDRQKNELNELRRPAIQKLMIKIFDELKDNIKNERVISKLNDKGYYDERIGEIREEFLTNRKKDDLHILRRWKLDVIQSETEDELFDINLELIENIQDLKELDDNSDIAQDIKNFNQTLLTGNRNIQDLIEKRKQYYNNGVYDNFIASINIETNVEELQNNWKTKIETEIDKKYLSQPKSIEFLNSLREQRIEELRRPSAKRPFEEDLSPTRLLDNVKPKRSMGGNINTQVSWIVEEYRKTLNKDDRKKLVPKSTIEHIKDLIKESSSKSKDSKTLLDVFYYIWVLGKDEKYLLDQKYTSKKIEEAKTISTDINNYLWRIVKKKIKTERNRLEKDPNYRNLTKYPFLVMPGKFSLSNPLGFPEEKIDNVININQIMIQYKESLLDKFSITPENLDIIHKTLLEKMNKLSDDKVKKEYLSKVFKMLVTRELN